MELKNKKLSIDRFNEVRKEVLASWSTGREVHFDEAVEYHKQIPPEKVFASTLDKAKSKRETLTQPRAGVALLSEHITLLRYLEQEGGADLLPTTIDSYTRQNQYSLAQQGIEESKSAGRSLLNGFPAVNHGVYICRQVCEAVGVPIQVRHGTPDARLLAEITLTGGFTSFEGGGITYNIPYAKAVPLERSIANWQYVDRLVGLFEEAGIRINREPFGPLTGTLVPPCISNTISIIEGLLAAEQGVKSITLGYGQCGNLTQDVAAIKVLEELGEEYMQKFGYNDVQITTVLHQWMGGFPQDEAKAFGVIAWGAATASLAGATKVITKSSHEAMGVPTKEANADGLKTSKQVLNMLRDQVLPLTHELEEEIEIIRITTKAILEKVLELGEDDIAVGTVRSFEAGVLDVPFAPSRYNKGLILPARDNQGAVRFLEPGSVPLPPDILKFHKDKLAKRGEAEGRAPDFQMVIDDIYAISKGRLVGRPR